MQKDMQKKDRRFRSRKNGHFTVAGSVTVEAALVLPLFIFFSFMLFSVFDMISTYCRFQSALTETAAEAAVLLYAKEDSMPDKEESFLLVETFIREEITRKTAKTLGGSVVEWDALGLHLFRSDMADESGNVRLILTYVVKPWFSIGGVGRMTMANHVTVHAWTGYEKPEEKEESDEEEQMVYVTKTGNAYHLYRDCTYLCSDVQPVFGEDIATQRSEDGSKYYPCEKCSKNVKAKDGEVYYITPWGNRYHADSSCNALFKSVEAIPISEVGSRHLCTKCAKRENK